MNAITWPADKTHLLRAIDSGLFQSPEGGTYAHVAGEGHLQVVRQPDGRYQIFWPQDLGEPGPFLKQIEGQTLWRPETASQPRHNVETDRAETVETPPGRVSPLPLPIEQVAWLTSAEETAEGLRYDRRGATYVDMDDGTTFLVRREPDGHYWQTSAHERDSLGAPVEPAPGTKRWRVRTPGPSGPSGTSPKDQDWSAAVMGEMTGPGKRPRLSEEGGQSDTAPLTEHLPDTRTSAPASPTAHWRNWGKTFKPEWHDSVKIEELHYVIVPQRLSTEPPLVFLENPLFTPGRFDAFEQMLNNNPSHQPIWAIKKDDTWTVVELPPFQRSLTASVAKTFRHFSDHSSSAIARAAFNEANHSTVINGNGLRVLFDTLYHWGNRSSAAAPRRELADPLMMLPILDVQSGNNLLSQIQLLPSPFAKSLKRIDFDTQGFHQQWRTTVETPGSSLRGLFSELLQLNGYDVDRTSRLFSDDALLFQRSNLDVVFVLRFRPSAPDGTIQRLMEPGEELNSPALRASLEKSRWKHLLDPDKVVYLVGGTQKNLYSTDFSVHRQRRLRSMRNIKSTTLRRF